MSQLKILQLLPKFKERFFHNFGKELIPYGRQRQVKRDGVKGFDGKVKPLGSIDYFTDKAGTITDNLLLKHFSQKVETAKDYYYGTLAVIGEWPVVKWICIDVDDPWQVEVAQNKILPQLEAYGITYLIEPSRDDRKHIWFMTNISQDLAEKFMTQFMIDCEQSDFKKRWEIYPLFRRRKSIFRIPGGHHFKANSDAEEGIYPPKAGKANGVIWNGERSNDPCFIMQAFLDLPVYSEHEIQSKIKLISPEVLLPKREQKKTIYQRFRYIPRDMPKPMDDLPPYLECMAENCQAIRKLLHDSVENDYIETPGIEHHNTLLVFSGLARFVNYVHKNQSGSNWFEKMLTLYRNRGVESHGLDADTDKAPWTGAWRCKTLDDYFGYCNGCPYRFRDGFENPKELYFGEKIKKVKVEDVIPSSNS